MANHLLREGIELLRYRLIATDIDGTLLNEKQEVTPRTRALLSELQSRGVTVVLSTARPPRSVRRLYRELGLTGPVIAYNGAMIYHPERDEPLLHHPIPGEVALRVVAELRALTPAPNLGLELEDEWHVDRIDQRLERMLTAPTLAARPIPGDVARAIVESNRAVSKLYFVGSPEERAAAEDRLARAGLEQAVAVTSSGSGMVEFLAAGVNKGAALRALAAILGIPREQTVALGDEENDIPALQAAGLGIAMGNAAEPVRAAAAVVAPPNTADGWADALERFVLAG